MSAMSSRAKPKDLAKKSGGGSIRPSQQSRPSQGQQHILEAHGFILGERVGKGSYGDVWKAYSTDHRSIVAVKVVSKQKAPPDFLEKFLPREIEIIKILQHPNIINFILSIETNKSTERAGDSPRERGGGHDTNLDA
ncbi:TSSK4 [Cordylochernes scorpioides]|uniref:TSSK4 n=1 Tax=Cordylochernes scorpioides TaxID=51811 RepID=A0ABY6K1T9_9ARAC|nr:TSSK4 [Cordylochernes scorpioides]